MPMRSTVPVDRPDPIRPARPTGRCSGTLADRSADVVLRRSPAPPPPARHGPGRALVPRLPSHLVRPVRLEHRHVDAELHAAGVHRASHRIGGARGLVVFVQLGPILVLSIPAGVLAERFRRRPYLIATQLDAARGSVALAVLVAADAAVWTLLAASLVVGIGNALNAPAFQASVPLLVRRPDLAGAISLNSVMINASRVIGPAIAAVLALVRRDDGAAVPRQRRDLPVPDRRDPRRAHPRRPRAAHRARLATPPDRHATSPASGPVLGRCLVTMCVFSVVCLSYVGLFPSVAAPQLRHRRRRRRLQAAVHDVGLRRLPRRARRRHGARPLRPAPAGRRRPAAVRRLPRRVRRRPHRRSRRSPSRSCSASPTSSSSTSLLTMFQENLRDTERASVMPLWFMAFGGTIPIGNLLFGPVIDAIGARWVLGARRRRRRRPRAGPGCDLRRLPARRSWPGPR